MNRSPLIAANLKMHSLPQGWDVEDSVYESQGDIDVVIFPMALDIHHCIERELVTGAQYGRAETEGAFTGDISMQQLASRGCTFVLCGHSERRVHHHESDELVAAQCKAAINAGLHPILCIGETADERELNMQEATIKRQLSFVTTPYLLPPTAFSIAYEPIWAIGSGEAATAAEAQEMHTYIRSLLPEELKETRILYGGSVTEENAEELIAEEDIDGFLVGGSSLKLNSFARIVEVVRKEMNK